MLPRKALYSVGIYARLSVDGGKKKKESIKTQIEIAKAFIRTHNDMRLYDCYVDIGETGTNFERKGFERMMQDAQMGKIDCIIVKDLSRFGRNHIETGNYMEKIFPTMGVRFIAITDKFDSAKQFGEQEILRMNLKNLVNEMYAKDIAWKIKSQKKIKREQGSYIGGVPPYGYRIEKIDGKRCLSIEETTSDIVKNIYAMFVSGKRIKEIASWLYQKKAVPPMEYHKTGRIYFLPEEQGKEWSKATIKMILTNPVYIGEEALICEEMFLSAGARFKKSSSSSPKIPVDEDIFAEILFCGDCGAKMQRRSVIKTSASGKKMRVYYYTCSKNCRTDKEKCSVKNISSQVLNDIVKEAIYQQAALSSAIQLNEGGKSHRMEMENEKKKWQKKQIVWKNKIKTLKKLESEQYVKYCMQEIEEDVFKSLKKKNEERIRFFQKQYEELNEKIEEEKKELPKEVVQTLIQKIEVYEDCRVKIIFSFKDSAVREKGE